MPALLRYLRLLTGSELCHGGATMNTGGRDTVVHAAAVLLQTFNSIDASKVRKRIGKQDHSHYSFEVIIIAAMQRIFY